MTLNGQRDVFLLPENIKDCYEIFTFNNPLAILKSIYPSEWNDLLGLLSSFKLYKEDIIAPGGRKSPIANQLDSFLYKRGWEEQNFDIQISVNGHSENLPTHKVDCFKNRIGIEIEWNNKDPFFDRDLNNFRLLYDYNALDVGIIITRATKLQELFKLLGKGNSYGASTTHMDKLLPRIIGKGAGGCPIAAFGISDKLYVEDKKLSSNS